MIEQISPALWYTNSTQTCNIKRLGFLRRGEVALLTPHPGPPIGGDFDA
jgi:hypothetical protein